MSLLDIQCCGKASSLFMRQKSDKNQLARRIFSPIHQHDCEQHEIANHYKDFKRKRTHREHRRRQSYPAKYLGSPKKRLSLTSTREILQMPCFVFPRFGKNFPWRGRQTQCKQNTTKIESETLKKISSAETVSDFNRLFLQTYSLSSHHLNHSDSTGKNSYNNPLTCHIEKGEVLSDRKPVTSIARITSHHHHQHRKGRARYNITAKVDVGGGFDDETENLEWYIELASRCYNEGFQWHMNYLNDCTRRSAVLKRRRLTGAATKANRIAHCSRSAETQLLLPSASGDEVGQKISKEDRFREEISDCKIRININQSLNSHFNNTKGNHNTNTNNNNNTRKRSNYSYVAHLNKKINIMNSGGYSIDAINVQNDMKTDRLNEVLDNFGSLNISCGSVLPQIVLTDFSSIDSMPRTNTLLLTPSSSAEQFNSINGTRSYQSHTECLSIPAEYYRNETRPC